MLDQSVIYDERWAALQRLVEDDLSRHLPAATALPEGERLAEAIGYALDGGKRVRPVLVLAACEAVGGDAARALPTASAVECFHAYSLVHDDLPAMDDDDVRRGKPTVHRRFGEATAILAGDALLTLGFEWLATRQAQTSGPEKALRVIRLLAGALGGRGMVGGQYLDLTQRFDTVDAVNRMQALKTSALLSAACEAGAVLGDGNETNVQRLKQYGLLLGQTYQLIDDLLDEEQDATGNASALNFASADHIETQARALGETAGTLLDPLGDPGLWLKSLAKRLALRQN